jgi:hypothetical protein
MKGLKIDKNTDRFQYYDTIRRISNNELNAALRNLVEEQRLQTQLLHYRNQVKANTLNQEKEIHKNQSFIRKVQANTGSAINLRQIQSAKSIRSKSSNGKKSKNHPQSAQKPLQSDQHFMQLICNSSSASFPNGERNNHLTNIVETKTIKDNMTGISFNYNDIYEISDSEESDNDEFMGSMFETGTIILGTIKPKKPKDLTKKHHTIRPMTTNIAKGINDGDESNHVKRQLFDCKTAPIARKKNGFKVEIQDDSNLAAWNKYKRDKAKEAKKGKTELYFEDESLEREYFNILLKKNQIPRHSPEEIQEQKKRDPIFAKRHTQFLNAKRNGKAATYDYDDVNARIFFPKWQIQKQREDMLEEKPTGIQILREHNQKNHQFINEKVKLFVKKFPAQTLKNFL